MVAGECGAGVGAAEDELAWYPEYIYFFADISDPKQRANHLFSSGKAMRESLGYAARAADKGFGRSRVLIAFAYAHAYLVPHDEIEAYKWLKLATTNDIFAKSFGGQLQERLLKQMPLADVQEGERRAAAYVPGNTPEILRVQMLLPELRFGGSAEINGTSFAIINGQKLRVGEHAQIPISGPAATAIYLYAIGRNSAEISLPPNQAHYIIASGQVAPKR